MCVLWCFVWFRFSAGAGFFLLFSFQCGLFPVASGFSLWWLCASLFFSCFWCVLPGLVVAVKRALLALLVSRLALSAPYRRRSLASCGGALLLAGLVWVSPFLVLCLVAIWAYVTSVRLVGFPHRFTIALFVFGFCWCAEDRFLVVCLFVAFRALLSVSVPFPSCLGVSPLSCSLGFVIGMP